MEFLAKVYDGSEHEIGNGYPLLKAVAADIESRKVIPLYCEAYSHLAYDIESENAQILKMIDTIFKQIGDKGIHAIDRGGDKRGYIQEISQAGETGKGCYSFKGQRSDTQGQEKELPGNGKDASNSL